MERSNACIGCRDGLANQETHMEFGGCLYSDTQEEQEAQEAQEEFFKRAEKIYCTEKNHRNWGEGSFVIITRRGEIMCLSTYSSYKEAISKLDELVFVTRVGFEKIPMRV